MITIEQVQKALEHTKINTNDISKQSGVSVEIIRDIFMEKINNIPQCTALALMIVLEKFK